MGNLRNVKVTEQRVYDDPKHPDASDYDLALPLTATQAVVDAKTGKRLDVTLTEIDGHLSDLDKGLKTASKNASDALTLARQAKEVADGAAQAIAAVQNTISVVPSQSTPPVYNGTKQKPAWLNFSDEMMTVTYGEQKTSAEEFQGETDAGTYKAYFTPKGDYTWGDKSKEEKEVQWTIERATIAKVPTPSALTYTGEAQAPTWDGYNAGEMTKEETSQTDAGQHSTSFTPDKNHKWPDGETGAKSVSWTIERAVVAVPTQNGRLTYTGVEQTVAWSGYDPAKMTQGGTQKGTGAGSYPGTFTPDNNHKWPDGQTGERTVEWTIGKAAGSVSIQPTSVKLSDIGDNQVITVTRDGDGLITATADTSGTIGVSISSGNLVVVTAKKEGKGKVTIKVAEGTNHLAPAAKECDVTVEVPKIYGASWDGTSTPKWTRTDASALFTDPNPAVNNGTGSSPFDNIQPWAGMVRSTRTGGDMVAIPKFWYKLTQNGKGLQVQISDKAQAGYSVSPAHMNRGDGKGERDTIYVGRYHCAAGTHKSETGKAQECNITRSQAVTNCKSVGATYSLLDFATRFTIWLLYIVEFANWDSQTTIGKGCSASGSKANNGQTDGMKYHTGTTAANRGTWGFTQYRNIEGLWDNVYDWLGGCYNSSAGLNIILDPAKYSDSANGTSVGTPSSGWPSAFTVSNKAGFPMFYPTEAKGSESTYSCDSWGFSTSNPCVFVGGSYNQSANRGLFCVSYSGTSSSYDSIGARLHELP